MPLTYGSLFAGAGGFDLGFDAAGMVCLWQCEKDKNCQKLLRSKWPRAKLYEDITTLKAAVTATVDIICGGSPCQNLSVAGARAGLVGSRSRLFFDMVRICKQQRHRGGAKFIVWENVDGAFSSNSGRDFACILRAFTGVQVEVPADGWGRAGFVKTPFPAWRWNCAWRVFDAKYFGVPQRRRRVFLVASAGDGSCAEILFEPESMRGDSATSGETREGIAGSLAARAHGGGGLGTDFETGGGLIPEVASPLLAGENRTGGDRPPGSTVDNADSLIPVVAWALQERDEKGSDSNHKPGHLIPVMAFENRSRGDDGRGYDRPPAVMDNCSPTLNTAKTPCVAFNPQAAGKQSTIGADKDSFAAINCSTRLGVSDFRGVRRLMPIECERLMGWGDGHTSGFKDAIRYRMCGNGVAAPVAEWIGRRIVQFAA